MGSDEGDFQQHERQPNEQYFDDNQQQMVDDLNYGMEMELDQSDIHQINADIMEKQQNEEAKGKGAEHMKPSDQPSSPSNNFRCQSCHKNSADTTSGVQYDVDELESEEDDDDVDEYQEEDDEELTDEDDNEEDSEDQNFEEVEDE